MGLSSALGAAILRRTVRARFFADFSESCANHQDYESRIDRVRELNDPTHKELRYIRGATPESFLNATEK